MTNYDLIVIGAGPVGQNVADRAKQGGLSVAIVEAELVGGECSYWACIPSKTLLRSPAAVRAAAAVDGASQAVTGTVDVAAILARRDRFVHDWDDASEASWLEEAGIELWRGRARISAEREVTVTGKDGTATVLTAGHAVALCPGSTAMLPDIAGLADARAWTSREATGVKHPPESLAIIGGGVVAVEMATAFAGFGTRVTVLSRGQLLGRFEPFVGELVADGLRDLGAMVRTGHSPVRVHRSAQGVEVHLANNDTVMAGELLVATGRKPRTDDLGLDTLGIRPGNWLEVDDTLRVRGHEWLYAVGDANHRNLLTHQGKYQARIAGDAIAAAAKGDARDDSRWGTHVATADASAVPQVVFASPEVASVGLTEREARDAGHDIRVVDYDLGAVTGASILADDYRGKARLVVDEQRGVVIGATFVGQDVAELLHAATIAVVGEVPIPRLWHAVPAFPTMSEVWLRLLEQYGRP